MHACSSSSKWLNLGVHASINSFFSCFLKRELLMMRYVRLPILPEHMQAEHRSPNHRIESSPQASEWIDMGMAHGSYSRPINSARSVQIQIQNRANSTPSPVLYISSVSYYFLYRVACASNVAVPSTGSR